MSSKVWALAPLQDIKSTSHRTDFLFEEAVSWKVWRLFLPAAKQLRTFSLIDKYQGEPSLLLKLLSTRRNKKKSSMSFRMGWWSLLRTGVVRPWVGLVLNQPRYSSVFLWDHTRNGGSDENGPHRLMYLNAYSSWWNCLEKIKRYDLIGGGGV